MVGLGVARQFWQGPSGRVVAGQGPVRRGELGPGSQGEVWHGLARRGVLWFGLSRLGSRRGARWGVARRIIGGASLGSRGVVWHGMVSCGGIRFGSAVMVRCAMAGLGCSAGLGVAAAWQSRLGVVERRLG